MEQQQVILQVDAKKLDRLLVDDPSFRKHINALAKKLLRKARADVSKDAKSNLKDSKRQAYQAVKYAVYRNLIGGNVSILQKRKATNKRAVFAGRRKLDVNPHQRGGNRVKRVDDDRNRLDSYWGSDRGFALRFSQGTTPRMSRYGNRGMIDCSPWFEYSSLFHMQEVQDAFAEAIDEYIDRLNIEK